MRIITYMLLLIILLTSCNANTIREFHAEDDFSKQIEPNQDAITKDDANAPMDTSTFINKEEIISPFGWGRWGDRLDASFIVEGVLSEEAITTHAIAYIAEKHQANEEIYGISIYYYENEAFFKFKDDPLATVWWGPEMEGSNEEVPEKGDFSFHKVWKPIIYSRNAEYSLDTSELELYSLFQNEYYKISGRYALPRLSRESILQADDVQIYQEVANRLGVEEDTLIDLRIKVTMYCLRD